MPRYGHGLCMLSCRNSDAQPIAHAKAQNSRPNSLISSIFTVSCKSVTVLLLTDSVGAADKCVMHSIFQFFLIFWLSL